MDVRINSSMLDSHLSIIQVTDLSIRYLCTNKPDIRERTLFIYIFYNGLLRKFEGGVQIEEISTAS